MSTAYHDVITEAIGLTDPADLAGVEDWMRNIIFHSTLDWQTRPQLRAAARDAVVDIRAYVIADYFGAFA
jgi:hypothetical protein